MLVNIIGAKCVGIDATKVIIETKISQGLGLHMVGLADAAVKESLLRTVTALQSLGYHIPGKKIVINLAPADTHKKGSGYDLPIGMGIIAASEQEILPRLDRYMIMGELGLDGSLRPVPGALSIAQLASQMSLEGCILPESSAVEAREISGIPIYGAATLTDVVSIVSGRDTENFLVENIVRAKGIGAEEFSSRREPEVDFADIVGQEAAKRALEIAASGSHNVMMVGSPGSGKSSLAKALAGILPPMTKEESLQTSKIYSVAGLSPEGSGIIYRRPFRSPHLSASLPAIIGGGSDNILPGEVSLAHNGVLFCDEFCQAPRSVIEALRAPMEDRKVVISRLRQKVEYPASFMLVGATNPCPCGYWGEGERCTCSPGMRESYLSKLSGPIVDRCDVMIWLKRVPPNLLVHKQKAEPSAKIAERVMAAREIQLQRFRDERIFCNSEMSQAQIDKYCRLDADGYDFLEKVMTKEALSARACSRILKIARTIADMDAQQQITVPHLAEAVSYRFLDKSK